MIDLIDRWKAIGAMGNATWAKERLMELPSAQPDGADTNVGTMISRQAAIDAAIAAADSWDGRTSIGRQKRIANALMALPYTQQEPSVTPKEQQWIPVSERLPEPRVDVWVNSDIGQIQGYYEEHIGVWYASFGQGRDYLELIVNAWMPLPEPYREEEQE